MNDQKVQACPPKFFKEKFRRARVFISGRVQGVFFRKQTRKKAKKIGITGWVKNLADGRVEAVFEGEEISVKTMIEWARRGPLLARVDGIEVEWESFSGEFKDFEIKY